MAHGLTKAGIKYLTAIRDLDPEGRGIRSIALARKLNVSRPSVHIMVEKLADEGFLEKEYYGVIYLTPKGMRAADHYAPRTNSI